MRVLIMGGTGFMGPHVVRRLVEDGHEVTVFHRGQTEADLPEGVRHVHGDRAELAVSAVELRQAAPEVVLDMIAMTERDATAAARVFRGRVRRLVTLSSGDVYRARNRLYRVERGDPDAVPLTEDAPLREILYPYRHMASGPDHPMYEYEKILVEGAVLGEPELPATVLRLPAVYGPGDRQRRVGEFLRRMDDGRAAILLPDGRAGWRWTRGYVENVAAAIVLAVEDDRATGRIYNVGEPDALTEAEWVTSIGHAAGWNGQVVAIPEAALPAHLQIPLDWRQHLVTDTGRIRAELGYCEVVSRADALARTVTWERATPSAAPPIDYAAEDAALAAQAR